MMIPGDFHFAKPWMGVLLFLTPVLYAFWRQLEGWRKQTADQFAEDSLRAPLEKPRSIMGTRLKTGGFLLAWIMGVVALMDPQGNGHYPSTTWMGRPPHEVRVLIDVSASMGVEDTRLGASRLALAKEIGAALLGRLKGDSIVVDVWTSELNTLVPETVDTLYPRLVIKEIAINEGGVEGTNILHVLEQLKEALEKEPLQKNKSILLFTDGGDTLLEAEPNEKRETAILEAVKKLLDENSSFSTIGMGSSSGGLVPGMNETVLSKLNDPLLKKMALAGQGRYFDTGKEVAVDVAERIAEYLHEGSSFTGGQASTSIQLDYQTYFAWPLSLALASLALVFLAPQTASRLFILFLVTSFSLKGEYLPSVYSDAGFWNHAQAILEQELQISSRPEWEKKFLEYNQGTNFLRAGHTDRSIETFQSIATTSPLLLYQVQWNLAIASFLEGTHLKNAEEAVLAFQSSSRALFLAEEAFCKWRKLMNDSICHTDQMTKLSSLIETGLSDAYLRLFQDQLQRMTKEDFVLLLRQRLQRIETLLSSSLDPQFLFVLEEGKAVWEPWLKQLTEKEEQEKGISAFHAYQEAIEEAKKGKKEETIKKIKASFLFLDQYLVTRPFNERLLAELRLLREKMTFFCLNGTTATSLRTLKEDYEGLLKKNEDSALMSRIWGDMDNFRQAVNHAWEAVQLQQEGATCFFMREAEQFLDDAIQHLKEGEEKLSLPLENALRKEQQAKALGAILAAIQQEKEIPSALQVVRDKQNEAIRAAETFAQAVSTWQKEHFRTGDEKQLCLHKPWDEVIPLYQEGLRQAMGAKTSLASQPLLLKEAMKGQNLSIRRWKEALEKIKALKEETEEEQQKAQSEERKDQLADLLQKMEQMDQVPIQRKIEKVPGERPW